MAREIKELTRQQLEDWGIQSVNFDGSEIIRHSKKGLVPMKPLLNNHHVIMCEWRYNGEHHYIPINRLVWAWHMGTAHANSYIVAKEGFDLNTTHIGQLQEIKTRGTWLSHCDITKPRIKLEEDLEEAIRNVQIAKMQKADSRTITNLRSRVKYIRSKIRFYDEERKKIYEEYSKLHSDK